MLTCVGSVTRATIRYAAQPTAVMSFLAICLEQVSEPKPEPDLAKCRSQSRSRSKNRRKVGAGDRIGYRSEPAPEPECK